jgi:hypothetical protein
MKITALLPALLLSLAPRAGASALENLPAAAAAGIPVPQASPSAPVKEWTVMYFVNGKNNLESSALMDVNQMELVGTTGKVNIVVEMGRMNGQEGDDHAEGDWTGVRRYLVAKDADTSRILSPVLESRARADMGSWKELADFIRWTKDRYPARRYALVMWDHGNGWKPVDEANAPDFSAVKGFSLDDETGHEISTPQLGAALKAAGGVNFLMLDGCNMAMASVAYEVKDYAEALTASEETEPGVVVRYAQFLALLNARPSMGAEEFAANTVKTYRDYFLHSAGDNEGAPVTQSALRLSKMTALRARLDAWAALAVKAEPEALRRAKAKAKVFGEDPDYKDLYDFVELVGANTARPELKAAGADVLRFIKKDLLIENWAQDAVSHGLSIYVPHAAYLPLYDGLAWARDGAWDDFARFMAAVK